MPYPDILFNLGYSKIIDQSLFHKIQTHNTKWNSISIKIIKEGKSLGYELILN